MRLVFPLARGALPDRRMKKPQTRHALAVFWGGIRPTGAKIRPAFGQPRHNGSGRDPVPPEPGRRRPA